MTAPVQLPLRGPEALFLVGLVGELRTLVAAPPELEDPLDNWAAELAAPPIDHADPVVERLFPRAYDDEGQDAEYRRLTETSLRSQKDHDAQVVAQDLAAERQGGHVVIAPEHVTAWLKTLNSLRLALAARLEIATADDADALQLISPTDPRHDVAQVYHWLSYLLESLLEAL